MTRTAIAAQPLKQELLRELSQVSGADQVSDLTLCRVTAGAAGYDWTIAMVAGPISDRATRRLLDEILPQYQARYTLDGPAPVAAFVSD